MKTVLQKLQQFTNMRWYSKAIDEYTQADKNNSEIAEKLQTVLVKESKTIKVGDKVNFLDEDNKIRKAVVLNKFKGGFCVRPGKFYTYTALATFTEKI